MKPSQPKFIDLKADELEPFLQRAKARLNQEDYETFKALVESYVYVTQMVEDKRTTINRLRKLLFGSGSEKSRDVIPQAPAGPSSTMPDDAEPTPPKRPGHGRHGADAYDGAEKIVVPHEFLKSGDRCPDCQKGKVYQVAQPGVLVRIVGQAPVQAKVYELQKLRCNLCGKVFTAQAPQGVGSEKYDATSASMIALLKYGSGLPFNRLEGLQGSLGIPLPASTQWDIVSATAAVVTPICDELIRQAAQGEVLHNDDTTMKILELMGKRAQHAPSAEGTPQRKGVFTSGIVSTHEGRRIALFFTGRRHAGENLAQVLAHRSSALGPPIQMCDALSRNLPKELKTIVANCLAHGRRQFVDVAEHFPDACRHVLEVLGEVYKNDAEAQKQKLSPKQRLSLHQEQSGPLMDELMAWFTEQFEEKKVEPNSGLGQAISYMQKHWEKLTLFLRQPGAPLDNNVCERALKKAILHRKNSLFYKSERGAIVGDLFMSLIYTCHLCDADPFGYLTALQRNEAAVSSNPQSWLPWNYREKLEPTDTSPETV